MFSILFSGNLGEIHLVPKFKTIEKQKIINIFLEYNYIHTMLMF